jgi:hemoglobin-like flavoprotein
MTQINTELLNLLTSVTPTSPSQVKTLASAIATITQNVDTVTAPAAVKN